MDRLATTLLTTIDPPTLLFPNMTTLKRTLLILLLLALPSSESFVKLAMGSLANVHILLNIFYNLASHLLHTCYPALAAQLPHFVNAMIAAVNDYYNQALVLTQPLCRAGAFQLTHYTAMLTRHAPCVLCKFLKWAKEWASYVGVRMMGEGMHVDGYMELQQQLVEIHEGMMYYCAAVGGCGLPDTVWMRNCPRYTHQLPSTMAAGGCLEAGDNDRVS